MNHIVLFIANLEWNLIIIICLTLGLAPFTPPHIYEKLSMLINGTLRRPLDWFDLFLHGVPWLVLIIKIIITIKNRGV
ncbi:MAG TPA: RND transporter [Spirochaetota bacterium]|nr:RND transporter [Spirochaetota bacterium]HPS86135.1 RND transporter [Spirochaetota bacterium]